MKEAFVYCWSDHATSKVYVGYHKGNISDGYICSSYSMLLEYKARPADFTREILYTGTATDSFRFEQKIIKQLIKLPKFTYNKRFGGTGIPWNKGISGIYSEVHRMKLREVATGRIDTPATTYKRSLNNANKGKTGNWAHAVKDDHYKKLSKKFTGKIMPTVACPYCSVIASHGNAKRWHFDNCKNKL